MHSDLRMKKTLASLVFAMTVTAVSLHWMDPSARASRNPVAADEIESLSRDAIGQAVQIKKHQWRDVEITIDDEVVSGGLALSASRNKRFCHFFIDAGGRPHCEKQWISQQPYSNSPNTVRIHLERDTENGPSAMQWAAVRTLILALDLTLSAGGNITIHSPSFEPDTVIFSSSL